MHRNAYSLVMIALAAEMLAGAAYAQPAAPATGPVVVAPAAPVAAAEVPKSYSYGNASFSVFFTPKQVERMKMAIKTYEDVPRTTTETTFVAPVEVENKPAEIKIDEPVSYPVFYLASIAYDTPSQWSLWVSGHKITSRVNNTDLSVVSVSRDSATFQWKPNYIRAIAQRRNANAFAITDPVKNKLAASNPITFDEAAGTLTFTLKPNQSFAVGYYSMFEGYIATPKLEAVKAPLNEVASERSGRSLNANLPPLPPEQAEARDRMKAAKPNTKPVGMSPAQWELLRPKD